MTALVSNVLMLKTVEEKIVEVGFDGYRHTGTMSTSPVFSMGIAFLRDDQIGNGHERES